eukprot:TRINITY_DN32080_c0_g1_i2.p1 TRINITY_DN32080_c0_g1~~TRINITY_DN32080_c0_g1_i2.p1  ORF type:complete len:317 (+),score=69.24 TRINITY_DN32080_c0_g1_i2:174-1124(+)
MGKAKMTINVLSVAVDGKTLPTRLNGGLAQLDSASTLTYLPDSSYAKLRAAIEEYCDKHNGCGALSPKNGGNQGLGRSDAGCWRMAAGEDLNTKAFPTILWALKGGATLQWQPSAYLIRQGPGVRWCYAFEKYGTGTGGPAIILGASWMLDHEVAFDVAGKRLGLSWESCRKSFKGGHDAKRGDDSSVDARVASEARNTTQPQKNKKKKKKEKQLRGVPSSQKEEEGEEGESEEAAQPRAAASAAEAQKLQRGVAEESTGPREGLAAVGLQMESQIVFAIEVLGLTAGALIFLARATCLKRWLMCCCFRTRSRRAR